ncbi:mechanosensitive ion channel family protein [uncultured Polaribacter sp.]|uniref:mechanosensitive ion channel family protein n=1 Tax=uncultured Polaribacter sp. TaxID=174711 RepID=UPI0026344130|nr:mechanosensitive ion channel family protein [uncultured Polaribacter sp.]
MTINTADFNEAFQEMYVKLNTWLDTFILNIPNIIIAIVVFLFTLLIAKYFSKLLQKLLRKTSIQISMRRVLGRAIAMVIVAIGLFLILGILDLDKTLKTILAGAGVAGLAVGLALQGALTNTFSGVVLSYIKNVKNGDWIKTNGYEGAIVDVDFRALTLRQKDNNLVYIPNKLVIENPIKNFSATEKSRVILENGVAYGSNLEKVKELTTQIIIDNFDVPETPEDVLFLYRGFGNSAITYEIRFWINSSSALEVAKAKSEAIMLIKKAYDKEGIGIPFPIRTLDFGNQLDKYFPQQQEV